MDDGWTTSNTINLGLFLLTGLGLGITLWKAFGARQAAIESEEHEKRALAASEAAAASASKAAASQVRAARALEGPAPFRVISQGAANWVIETTATEKIEVLEIEAVDERTGNASDILIGTQAPHVFHQGEPLLLGFIAAPVPPRTDTRITLRYRYLGEPLDGDELRAFTDILRSI